MGVVGTGVAVGGAVIIVGIGVSVGSDCRVGAWPGRDVGEGVHVAVRLAMTIGVGDGSGVIGVKLQAPSNKMMITVKAEMYFIGMIFLIRMKLGEIGNVN